LQQYAIEYDDKEYFSKFPDHVTSEEELKTLSFVTHRNAGQIAYDALVRRNLENGTMVSIGKFLKCITWKQ